MRPATTWCAVRFVAVHTLLAVEDAAFVSLLDPPEEASIAVARCENEGSFPVLIGDDDALVLSSPIILYDHPEVAPESPGDLYDATEIDEILALRVMTLTDEEKAEARGTDARAAAIIDRCESMSPDAWARLHGTMRSSGGAAARRRSSAVVGPGRRRVGRSWDRCRSGRHGRRAHRDARPAAPVSTRRRARSLPGRDGRNRCRRVPRCRRRVARRGDTRRRPRHRGARCGKVATSTSIPRRSSRSSTPRSNRDRHRCSSPESETSSCATTGSASRSRAGSRQGRCPRASGWSTSVSADCTSPTNCSTATTRSCSSTRCRWASRRGRSRLSNPTSTSLVRTWWLSMPTAWIRQRCSRRSRSWRFGRSGARRRVRAGRPGRGHRSLVDSRRRRRSRCRRRRVPAGRHLLRPPEKESRA